METMLSWNSQEKKKSYVKFSGIVIEDQIEAASSDPISCGENFLMWQFNTNITYKRDNL